MTWRIPPIGWCVTCWRKGEEQPAWGLVEGTSLCKDCLREVLPKALAFVEKQLEEVERLPEDAPWPREECGNRGPRVGEDITVCRRSKGHDMPHRTAPSDGHGDVEWWDPTPPLRRGYVED